MNLLEEMYSGLGKTPDTGSSQSASKRQSSDSILDCFRDMNKTISTAESSSVAGLIESGAENVWKCSGFNWLANHKLKDKRRLQI